MDKERETEENESDRESRQWVGGMDRLGRLSLCAVPYKAVTLLHIRDRSFSPPSPGYHLASGTGISCSSQRHCGGRRCV